MGIRVVRFEHQSWRPRSDKGADLTESLPTILLFDPRLERGAGEVVGDRFRRLDAGARDADLLVIRASDPELKQKIDEDEMLETLRQGSATLTLSPLELGAEPTLQTASWSPKPEQTPTTAELREAEILCGLNDAEAIYRQSGMHYLMPNTRYHAEAFVRLGDSLNDQVDLIRLSDWLLPRVDGRTGLLADNGSMLALLMTLALRANQTKGYSPQIATLDEYPVTPTAVGRLVDRLRVGGGRRLLCCVSVSSSGGVARSLDELAEIETEVVILCETENGNPPDDGIERFSRLPVPRWEIGEDGRCERCNDLHLLAVSPRSYELRAGVKLKPEGLDPSHASKCRDFWVAAQEAGAVSLHVEAALAKGSVSATRHLGVKVDVAKLLAAGGDFRARCLKSLRAISPPDLILIPEHAASRALGELVSEAFPEHEAEKVLTCGVGTELPDLLPVLKGLDHVLLIDDALVSGSTLRRLRLAIQQAAVELDTRIDVTIFVPLSRPADPEDQLRVERSVARPDKNSPGEMVGFHCAQELLLPDQCPWCNERDLLEGFLDGLAGESHEFVSERLERLRRSPLEPPLLPLGRGDERKIVGSIFGDLEPLTAFAAVSAHGQHLHDRIERIRIDETIKVVDLQLLLQAFFDPVIVAALLRTLPPRDLRDPGTEHLVRSEIRSNGGAYEAAALAELAHAALLSKLPAAPVRKALAERTGEAWARTYLELLADY